MHNKVIAAIVITLFISLFAITLGVLLVSLQNSKIRKIDELNGYLLTSTIFFCLSSCFWPIFQYRWEDKFHLVKRILCSFYLLISLFWFAVGIRWISSFPGSLNNINNNLSAFPSSFDYFGLFPFIISCLLILVEIGLFAFLSVLIFLGIPPKSRKLESPTSSKENNSFEVDFLHEYPNIGMSISPGRNKGKYNRSLYADLNVIKEQHNIDIIVTMLTHEDLYGMSISDFPEKAEELGIQWIHIPVRDKWIPESINEYEVKVKEIVQQVKNGKKILVHCNGGKGRTGTFVVCCQIELGKSTSDAIKATRTARPGTIRNPLQVWWVYRYEEKWKEMRTKRRK